MVDENLNQGESKRAHSVTLNEGVGDKKPGFSVAASPFNGVKLELGFILLFALILLLLADKVTSGLVEQFLLLLAYGTLSMGWIIFRVKKTLQNQPDNSNSEKS